MVRMGKVTKSSSLALALIVALGGVEAYVPLASIRTRRSPSFLVLPHQQQHQQQQRRCIVGTATIQSRCLPLFSTPGPDAPITETKDSVVDSEESTTSPSKATPGDGDNITDILLFRVAAGLAAALAAYGIASLAITTTTEFATFLSESISSGFWGAIASFPDTLGAILAAIFGFFKFLIPALGKLGMSAYETASPIVSETSQRAIEAATPVLQETATKVADATAPYIEEASKAANEAAAPYVDQLNSAVQEAKGAVDTQIQGATEAASKAVDAQIQGASRAVDAQIQGATKAVGDAVDAQIQRIVP